jgi:ABC-type anion transport system duplicated permease subunit
VSHSVASLSDAFNFIVYSAAYHVSVHAMKAQGSGGVASLLNIGAR